MKSVIKESKIFLEFTNQEALILFDWLFRFNEAKEKALPLDKAEERILWDMEASLEQVISETFQENYNELLVKARKALLDDE